LNQIVDKDGNLKRIERDAEKSISALSTMFPTESTEPIVRDDKTLAAFGAHLGLLGVVTSVVLLTQVCLPHSKGLVLLLFCSFYLCNLTSQSFGDEVVNSLTEGHVPCDLGLAAVKLSI
jgi:hypothetical protein